tara:strand:+ start:400 stop:699 length:300 start_codon:yes stop_codon:yes gene_type:complete
MAEMKEFELLNDATNAVVVRHPERNFPGLLIQGDTLKTLLDDIDELREEAFAGDLESVKEISIILQDKFTELLTHYEKVLTEHGLEHPYVGSVRSSFKG